VAIISGVTALGGGISQEDQPPLEPGVYTIVFQPEDGGPERDYCTIGEIGHHRGEYNIMAFCTATRPPDDS
jgi:hypothetical protein